MKHEWVQEQVTPDIESRYGRGSLIDEFHQNFWRCNNCGYALYCVMPPSVDLRVEFRNDKVSCEWLCELHVRRIMAG